MASKRGTRRGGAGGAGAVLAKTRAWAPTPGLPAPPRCGRWPGRHPGSTPRGWPDPAGIPAAAAARCLQGGGRASQLGGHATRQRRQRQPNLAKRCTQAAPGRGRLAPAGCRRVAPAWHGLLTARTSGQAWTSGQPPTGPDRSSGGHGRALACRLLGQGPALALLGADKEDVVEWAQLLKALCQRQQVLAVWPRHGVHLRRGRAAAPAEPAVGHPAPPPHASGAHAALTQHAESRRRPAAGACAFLPRCRLAS